MNKFDVEMQMHKLADQQEAWHHAHRGFRDAYRALRLRLVLEGLRLYMSVEDVAKMLEVSQRDVRDDMRRAHLNPKRSKTMLAKSAADALNGNASLLGIEPGQVDLLSPLAYLPMGDRMRRELQDQTLSEVTDIPEPEEDSE